MVTPAEKAARSLVTSYGMERAIEIAGKRVQSLDVAGYTSLTARLVYDAANDIYNEAWEDESYRIAGELGL